MALVKCKECGQEVSSKAGTCPKCGAPTKKRTSAFTWLVTIVVVIVLIGAFSGEEQSGSATSASQNQVKVGESVSTPTFEIAINRVVITPMAGPNSPFATKAADGGTYVAAFWHYKNVTPSPVSSIDLPSLYLKSPDGTRYSLDVGASMGFADAANINTKVVSDLNPGVRVTDATAFEVNRELLAKGRWKLIIDADKEIEVGFNSTTGK